MKHEVLTLCAMTLGVGTALTVCIPLARGDAKATTIAPSEIKEGMKGYGLTVFKGTEPEKFDVEVVGVLHNFRPAQELILVKTMHPRLAITKNVRGMSGSPIYFDGRLAGAYAYSWAAFQVEPVAGVTPIAPMLAELRRPIPPGFWPLEGAAPLPGKAAPPSPAGKHAEYSPTRWEGDPGSYDAKEHQRQVASRLGLQPAGSKPLVPVATPLMLAGMGDRTAAYVKKMFEPLGFEPMQAGGGGAKAAESGAPTHFVNGGSLGVQMVAGDVSFFGLGTVTHVEGSKLCGFGHPMMEVGQTALPSALGRVLWIFASDQHSSKIGESIRPLGALTQDRMSAVVVDETKTAPTFPVHITVKGAVGAPKTDWNAVVAEEKYMSAGLAAAVFGSVIEATTNERRDVTWKLTSKVSIQGHGTLELEDFGIATGGMPDAGDFSGSRVVRAVGEVLNNPWERTRIEKIESVFTMDYTRELYRLRGVDAIDASVEAGQKARLRLHLFPVYGQEVVRVIEVPIPQELAGKDVELEIVPGFLVAPDMASPESLNDLLANALKQSYPPKSLVVQFKTAQGVAFHGHVAPRLPAFALDTLRSHSSDTGPDAVPGYVRTIVPIEKYVDGSDKVKIKVKSVLR